MCPMRDPVLGDPPLDCLGVDPGAVAEQIDAQPR